MSNFAVERVDHLGIVAGVCQEIGLVEYFDLLDEGHPYPRKRWGFAVPTKNGTPQGGSMRNERRFLPMLKSRGFRARSW